MAKANKLAVSLTREKIDQMTPDEILETFTEREQKALERYRNTMNSEVDHRLEWYYDQGAYTKSLYQETLHAKKTRDGETRKQLYRDNLFPRLAKALALKSETWFLDVMRLADRYPTKTAFRREIINPRGPNGERLGWTQAALLCTIEDDDRRRAMRDKTLQNAWTYRELQTEIQSLQGVRQREGVGGPKIKPATSVSQCLTNARKMAGLWVGKCEHAWMCDEFHIRRAVEEIPADRVNDEVLQELAATRSQLEQVADHATRFARYLLEAEQGAKERQQRQETMQEEQPPEAEAEEESISMAEHRRRQQKANPKKKAARGGKKRPGVRK